MRLFRFLAGTLHRALLAAGIILFLLGALFSITLIGAIIGIPLIIMGMLLIIAAFFLEPRRPKPSLSRKLDEEVIDIPGRRVP